MTNSTTTILIVVVDFATTSHRIPLRSSTVGIRDFPCYRAQLCTRVAANLILLFSKFTGSMGGG